MFHTKGCILQVLKVDHMVDGANTNPAFRTEVRDLN